MEALKEKENVRLQRNNRNCAGALKIGPLALGFGVQVETIGDCYFCATGAAPFSESKDAPSSLYLRHNLWNLRNGGQGCRRRTKRTL
eukprot:3246180-Rhodomonas_salina.2